MAHEDDIEEKWIRRTALAYRVLSIGMLSGEDARRAAEQPFYLLILPPILFIVGIISFIIGSGLGQ